MAKDIWLTPEERKRFSEYLKQQAESDKLLVNQMEKVNTPEAFIMERRKEVMAYLIVAKVLDSIQSTTIGGSDVQESMG